MADDFAAFNRKITEFQRELDGTKLKAKLEAIGKAAKGDAAEAVRNDIGDQSMSNWRRNRPIDITARYELPSDHEVEVTPTPRNRGPWRVLEDGRQAGGAFDLVLVGRVRKTGKNAGTKRAKSRGRNQGATDGKSTWSDGAALMEKRTPDRVDKYVVKAAIRNSGV